MWTAHWSAVTLWPPDPTHIWTALLSHYILLQGMQWFASDIQSTLTRIMKMHQQQLVVYGHIPSHPYPIAIPQHLLHLMGGRGGPVLCDIEGEWRGRATCLFKLHFFLYSNKIIWKQNHKYKYFLYFLYIFCYQCDNYGHAKSDTVWCITC